MQSGIADFRSDTVTQPTPAMRQAMARAVVGDDVYGDDPTINKLERCAADLLGKESALFVPSGTMGNELAIAVQCQRGDEVILPDNCHVVIHESGAAAYIAGVQLRCLPTGPGIPMAPATVEQTIRKTSGDPFLPHTSLLTYENADSDGYVRDLAYMDAIRDIADRYGLPIHLDGARLFNAAAVLGVEARDIADRADSVMFCLSKGLCAPVGSILCGAEAFISKARRLRKILGGGMRQAGILAAAGQIALDEMRQLLVDDHEKARTLSSRLSGIPGIEMVVPSAEINMVFFRMRAFPVDEAAFIDGLRSRQILINPPDDGLFRLVTHHDVSYADITRLAESIQSMSGV